MGYKRKRILRLFSQFGLESRVDNIAWIGALSFSNGAAHTIFRTLEYLNFLFVK